MGNILLTTLAVFKRDNRITYAYYEDENSGEKYYSANNASHEAGSKFYLWKYPIDKIVVIGSAQTIKEGDNRSIQDISEYASKGYEGDLSSYEIYVRRIADYLSKRSEESDREYFAEDKITKAYSERYAEFEKLTPCEENKVTQNGKKIEVVFVPEETNGGQLNYQGLLDALKGAEEKNNIYMDIQAGLRTAGFIRNSVVQLISDQAVYNADLKQVVAIAYNPENKDDFNNPIKDETNNYYISEFFAGMQSLLSYGKVDGLTKYLEKLGIMGTDIIQELITTLRSIDMSFSSNSIENIDAQTKELKDVLDRLAAKNYLQSDVAYEMHTEINAEMLFSILEQGIREEYKPLFSGDILDILKWCIGKQLYSAAATLAESRLPRFFVQKGMIYCVDSELFRKYLTYYDSIADKDNFKFKDPYIYLVKYYKYNLQYFYLKSKLCKGKGTIGPVALATKFKNDSEKLDNIFDLYDILCDMRNRQNHGGVFDKNQLCRISKKLCELSEKIQNKKLKNYLENKLSIDCSNKDKTKGKIEESLKENLIILELLGVLIECMVESCRQIIAPDNSDNKTLDGPMKKLTDEELTNLVRELICREMGTKAVKGTIEKDIDNDYYLLGNKAEKSVNANVLDPLIHQIKRYEGLKNANDNVYDEYIKSGNNKEFFDLICKYYDSENPEILSTEMVSSNSKKIDSDMLHYNVWKEMLTIQEELAGISIEKWIEKYQEIKKSQEGKLKQEVANEAESPYKEIIAFMRKHSWKDIIGFFIDDEARFNELRDTLKKMSGNKSGKKKSNKK